MNENVDNHDPVTYHEHVPLQCTASPSINSDKEPWVGESDSDCEPFVLLSDDDTPNETSYLQLHSPSVKSPLSLSPLSCPEGDISDSDVEMPLQSDVPPLKTKNKKRKRFDYRGTHKNVESPLSSPASKKTYHSETSKTNDSKRRLFKTYSTSDDSDGEHHSRIDDSDGEDQSLFKDKWPIHSREITGWTSIYAAKQILSVPQHMVSDTVPQLCQDNATFVVDTSKLDHKSDVTGDDNGAWGRPSGYKTKLTITKTRCKYDRKEGNYLLRRSNYHHKGTSSFRRIIYELEDSDKHNNHM
jgi:hypothetical protein